LLVGRAPSSSELLMLSRPLQLLGAALMALLATLRTANATASGGGPIPEPSLAVLLAVGVGGAILYGRSRRGRR
jgi:hypothetical protein